ncbi:NHLP bacteriocin system secretion protein [Nostoc sp. MS1]|uniref:NHLP bacteriocin system secretion protein n=1 Tax=Nostoc sp. MS1 TaxID=2764711 RepID=UPI001CC56644|nr:NHLP bacteriocin system secretion protein [Nostoc sp. MS1]BCL39334.1 hypothetical protein NSMS1_57810 [Nostoc sp. MS1]
MEVKKQNKLFRQKSLDRLEKLSSPEGIDHLVRVVSPQSWLLGISLSVLGLLAISWAFFGRIPITVAGQGVLIHPRKVVDLQSTASGQVIEMKVRVGQDVKQGDLLAIVDQTELKKQLQQQRTKLLELTEQNLAQSELQQRRASQEQLLVQQERLGIQQKIEQLQTITPALVQQELFAIHQRRVSIEQNLKSLQNISPELQERLNKRQSLQNAGAISDDLLLEAKQTYIDNLKQISQMQADLKDLDVRQLTIQKSLKENANQILDLQTRSRALDTRTTQLQQQDLETATTRLNKLQDVKREIARLELQLQGKSEIRSKYNGRVLELATSAGQVLNPGVRLGSIDVADANSKILALVYLPIQEGKKVKPGMSIEVTPDTVQRARFGGIVGRVSQVSPFPDSRQGAISLVGNAEIVDKLLRGQTALGMFVELQKDSTTFSGYRWSSSSGPQLQITPGTTVNGRITVEERAPITFILPSLKSTTGLD